MFRFTKSFLTSSDTAEAKKDRVEQKIIDWLFEQFGLYTLADTCSVIASVIEAFPPVDKKATITSALLERIQVALVRWGQGLQDLAQPTRDEASQMGKELFLLILHETHPDYVELVNGKPGKKTAVAALDLSVEAVRLLKALKASSEYPHPYVTLPSVPSLLFPLENAETGERIWIEISPTLPYSFSVIAHRRKPRTRDVTAASRETAMGGITVDYYTASQPTEKPLTRRGTLRQRWKRQQEVLQIQLFDETVGPYDDPHWLVPDDYSASEPGPSILLVRDVRRWKAPEEDPAEADAATHQEAYAANVSDHPAKKGDHYA